MSGRNMTRAVRSLMLGPALLGACVATPAQLLQQLTGLDTLATQSSALHKRECLAPPADRPEPAVCGILISCFAELQSASEVCRQAIAQGRTSTDQEYAARARACVQASRVTATICPKLPAAPPRGPHVP